MLRGRETEKQKVIAQVYGEMNELLRIYVRTCVSDTDEVEDIIQEVFMEALRRFDVFSTHPNQSGWLYVTARHKIQEHEKRRRRYRIADGDIEDEFSEIGEWDRGYLLCELDQTIQSTLTPEEIQRFKRYFLWGYTVEELAEREGITVNNMRVRITRLRRKLRDIVADV